MQPVAATGTAEQDQELVTDELTAAVSEDRWAIDPEQARYYWLH